MGLAQVISARSPVFNPKMELELFLTVDGVLLLTYMI